MGFIETIQQLAAAAGAPGLFLLSVVDSAGVPTGGGPDVLLILQAAGSITTARAALLVLLAALGSTAGCLVLYAGGRRSGRIALRRFSERRVEQIHQRLDRHGMFVVFLAVLAPPPYPTKLFILCSGVFGMRPLPVAVSTLFGRLIRYGTGALLGMHFGARGLELMQAHAATPGLALVGITVGALLLWWRFRRRSSDDDEAQRET